MNNQQKKKSQGFPWAVLVILIPLLTRVTDGEFPPVAFGVVVLIVILALAFAAKKKDGTKSGSKAPAAAPVRKTSSVELHRPMPSMQRREPVTAQRQFPQPEAHCVVCDNTGEDHFARDRKRRIEQLDEWLKNGLIDKEEYRVLKYRFERDL